MKAKPMKCKGTCKQVLARLKEITAAPAVAKAA